MTSYNQEHFSNQENVECEDLGRHRSSTMPLSIKEDSPVVKRRTIFDPMYRIFSPEENTNDYLEDYLENLGEYHVKRDTRHFQLQTPLQFGSQLEKESPKPEGLNETKSKEPPKRNQERKKSHEDRAIKSRRPTSDNVNARDIKISQKDDITVAPSNVPNKRSLELQELKIYHSRKSDNQDAPSSAPIRLSQNTTPGNSLVSKPKETQKSLNAIKTLSSKKIHVDSPKKIQKGFGTDCQNLNENPNEKSRHLQIVNANNTGKPLKDMNSTPQKTSKVLNRGVSTEEKSPKQSSKALKLPKTNEINNVNVSPESSMKRASVAPKSVSPKPLRKEPPKSKKKETSTMHSFFEAFM